MTISTKVDKIITTSEDHFNFMALNFVGILEDFNNAQYGCYSILAFILKMESATRNTFFGLKRIVRDLKNIISSALFIIIFKPKW